MIKLRDYQENAVEELLNKSKKLFSLQGNKTIIFEAPTGSGKTIMAAEFLKCLSEGFLLSGWLPENYTARARIN